MIKKNKSKSLRNFEISMSKKLQRNGSLLRATGSPLSALIKEQHKLHKKTFFPDLASRQMKTKPFFSSQAGKQNLKFWRFPITRQAIVCERFFNCDLICNVWKFCKDQTFAHTDFHTWVDPSKPSIKLNLTGSLTDFQSSWIVALGILTSPRIFRFYSPRVQEY